MWLLTSLTFSTTSSTRCVLGCLSCVTHCGSHLFGNTQANRPLLIGNVRHISNFMFFVVSNNTSFLSSLLMLQTLFTRLFTFCSLGHLFFLCPVSPHLHVQHFILGHPLFKRLSEPQVQHAFFSLILPSTCLSLALAVRLQLLKFIRKHPHFIYKL